MIFAMFITLVLVAAVESTLLWMLYQRLADHIKENPEAVAALTNHLFVPLAGKRSKEPLREQPPQQPSA